MAYGKDIFRTKYREANEGLKTIQNNYFELDHEYQMLAKRVEKASKIVKDIFKNENWYNNYDYNDLGNALKEVDEVLNGGDDNE